MTRKLTSRALGNNSVTSDAIANDAVIATKIATGAITVADIPDGEITPLKLASTLDLSLKTVSLPAEAVTAHVTPYDDNDLYINLALTNLQLATYANIVKYGLKDFLVDKFEDTSGINTGVTTATRNASEYYWAGETASYPTDTNTLFLHQFESGNLNNIGTWGGTLTQSGGSYTSGQFNNAYNANGVQYLYYPTSNSLPATSDWTWEFWHRCTQTNISNGGYVRSGWLFNTSGGWQLIFRQATDGYNNAIMQLYHEGTNTALGDTLKSGVYVADGVWHHHALVHDYANRRFRYYIDGALRATSSTYPAGAETGFPFNYMYYGNPNQPTEAPNQFFDSARLSNVQRYTGSTYTIPTLEFSPTITVYTPNSSGSVESTSNTATATPTKANLIITYQNAAGTATVNTDIIGYVSRDGGTTYTPVTFVNAGTLGSNIVLAANDISLTSQPSGTSMKWKVAFANQSGSKQTRLYGVSLSWN
jgi:hypothetical protein